MGYPDRMGRHPGRPAHRAMASGRARSNTHKRVPSDHDGEKVLLRTVRCLSGSMDFVLECEPAFDYGRQRAVWHHTGDGYGEAEARAEDDARRSA